MKVNFSNLSICLKNSPTRQTRSTEIQELLHMVQVLDVVNFIGFFNNWYFKLSHVNDDMNLRFKMVSQSLGILTCTLITFCMTQLELFTVAQEIHSHTFKG